MAMRARIWFLTALALGAGIALWSLSESGTPRPPTGDGSGESDLLAPDENAAMLEGQTPRNRDASTPDMAADPDRQGTNARGPAPSEKLELITLRLRTADGDAAPLSKVVAVVVSRNGPSTQIVVHVSPEGIAELKLTPAEVQMLTVKPFSRGKPGEQPTLLTWEPGQGALEALPPIVVKHAHVRARTVDSRGDPRPDQRVLFRRRETGRPDPGWYGQRSDDKGWLEIGPFPIGARIEMRPGWRGQRGKDLAATPDKWLRTRAGEEAVELFVGDQPRLLLTFTDRGDDKQLPITVIDPATGRRAFPTVTIDVTDEPEQQWRAPSLQEGKPYEVVVGPTQEGLFARVKLEEIPFLDVPIRLIPGTRVGGHVTCARGWDVLSGKVQASGRGFTVVALFGPDGRFEFAGLPEGEHVRFVVSAKTVYASDDRFRLPVMALQEWAGETWLDLQIPDPAPITVDPVYKVPKSIYEAIEAGR